MSEFLPPPAPIPSTDVPKRTEQLSWFSRPVTLGLSIPWLVGIFAVVVLAAWFFFIRSDSPTVSKLAFGDQSGFVEQAPVQGTEFSNSGPQGVRSDINVAMIQDQVAAMVTGVRNYAETNRTAIEQLSAKVKVQSDSLIALKQEVSELQAQNSILSAAASKAAVRPVAAKSVATHRQANPAPSPITGMRVHAIQNGMAWVVWQDKTWAVQVGDLLGAVTVTGIDAPARRVLTTAGPIQ
ncbi:conjugal transfer protein TraP [Pseudomonas viridiflava]